MLVVAHMSAAVQAPGHVRLGSSAAAAVRSCLFYGAALLRPALRAPRWSFVYFAAVAAAELGRLHRQPWRGPYGSA